MPQYELMYLLGASVADTDVPQMAEQVKKFITDFGGSDIVEQQLGKKKLAYPIGKTRNGHYVVVNFNMDGKKVNDLDAKIRTQDSSIIRYLLVNIDEHLKRTAKDKAIAAKIVRREPPLQAPERKEPVMVSQEKIAPLVELDEKALDEKIEAALAEDLTK